MIPFLPISSSFLIPSILLPRPVLPLASRLTFLSLPNSLPLPLTPQIVLGRDVPWSGPGRGPAHTALKIYGDRVRRQAFQVPECGIGAHNDLRKPDIASSGTNVVALKSLYMRRIKDYLYPKTDMAEA